MKPELEPASFDGATYYDCTNSEVLEHETVEACLADYFEMFMHQDSDAEAVIREHTPVEVTAYVRKRVSDIWLTQTCEALAEWLGDWFDEEYGNPDGDDCLGRSELNEFARSVLKPAVGKFLDEHATVWECKQVSVRTYEADEALTMIKEYYSYWFDPKESA